MATLIHYIHVLSAIVWIGGMLFVGFVATPIYRRELDDKTRVHLIVAVGRRFRPFAWTALILLWGTGLIKLWHLIGLHPTGAFFQQGYGRILMFKLTLVFVATIIEAIHDFVIGRRYERYLARDDLSSAGYKQMRRWTILLAITNEIMVLTIVLLAVMLRSYGLPLR